MRLANTTFFIVLIAATVAISASAASTPNDGTGRRVEREVSKVVPYRSYACVNWDTTIAPRRPIRVVLNDRRYLEQARAAVKRARASKKTRFRVLRRSYFLAAQLRTAARIAAEFRPSGAEWDYSVTTTVEQPANDSSTCARVEIILVSYQGHPITESTRSWANSQVARYGAERVIITERSVDAPDRSGIPPTL